MKRSRSQILARSLGIEDPGRQVVEVKREDDFNICPQVSGVFLLLMVVFHLCFGIVFVDGDSMNPTLVDGQVRVFNKLKEPQIGDIVVVEERLVDDYPSHFIIKRVIGLPGDTIRVQKGHLYRNGELVEESYLDRQFAQKFSKEDWMITIPDGYLFVLGDNRDISKDSRQVGSFKQEAVRGIVY